MQRLIFELSLLRIYSGQEKASRGNTIKIEIESLTQFTAKLWTTVTRRVLFLHETFNGT